MSSDELVPIASLREGTFARVRGRVRRANELLTSTLGQRACVYFDVRRGLEIAPHAHQGVDFWLEDASGRVLVRAEGLKVEARAERTQEVLGRVDHDIQEVSRRQRAVKEALRAGGGDAKALRAERRRLAAVATLLCAVRAQARGRVHIGGSNAAQHAWIMENAAQVATSPIESTLRLVIDQFEVVLAEDDEVEIEGECALVPAPPGSGDGGYRDRASCLALHAPAHGALIARGVGAGAVSSTPETPREHATPAHAPRAMDSGSLAIAIVTSVVTVLWLIAWLTR